MTTAIPRGREGLIPHLVCDPCADAIEFYKKAFDAEEVGRMAAPGGAKIMHAAILIDGRPVFLSRRLPRVLRGQVAVAQALGGTPVTIHRYVEDCDAAIAARRKAGATVKMPASDMFWGDRYGVVIDPFGHSMVAGHAHQRPHAAGDGQGGGGRVCTRVGESRFPLAR